MELPAEAFMLFDEEGNAQFIDEGYEISIGGSQPDHRSFVLTGRSPQTLMLAQAVKC